MVLVVEVGSDALRPMLTPAVTPRPKPTLTARLSLSAVVMSMSLAVDVRAGAGATVVVRVVPVETGMLGKIVVVTVTTSKSTTVLTFLASTPASLASRCCSWATGPGGACLRRWCRSWRPWPLARTASAAARKRRSDFHCKCIVDAAQE